jgi:Glycosyl transferase family 11
MKIIIRQLSGLGNQMFQYAAGRYYARLYQAQMRIATDPPHKSMSYGHPRPFLLSHFAIDAPFRELNSFERMLLLTDHRRLGRLRPVAASILQHGLRLQIVDERLEKRFCFQPKLSIRDETRLVYLTGYWQVYKIAESIAADLRREFSLRRGPTGKNREMLRAIRSTENSVSLHIRRGDYTLQAEGNVALPMEYYSNAIARLNGSVSRPTFFIFSDDADFARASIARNISAVLVDHNDSLSAHEDLRLMSACRHHIIANSTFSWWGAWLGSAADKTVYAPRNWMVGNRPRYDDLFPPTWQLLG